MANIIRNWQAAARSLRDAGVSAGHVHIATMKPFDEDAVLEAIAGAKAVVTVENLLVYGGLGSMVAALMAENGMGKRPRRLGLRDRYGGAGSAPYLIEQCGFSARHIASAVAALLELKVEGDRVVAPPGGEGDLARQEAL